MRLFTAALFTETNTFSPIPTGWRSFEEFGIQRGCTGLRPAFHTAPLLEWEKLAHSQGHEIHHSVAAAASPAGLTVRATYERLRDEIVRDAAENGPFDVALLLLHGAMAAHGYDDCEGDLLERLRAALGPGVRIGVELDLHCHLTQAMLSNADLILTLKEYPHTDAIERARELYALTIAAAEGRTAPTPIVHDCRMIGVYFTQNPEMRAFLDEMSAAEEDAVLSVSLVHGFPWGDVSDNGTKLLVYADGNARAGCETARRLAQRFWSIRDRVAFKGLRLAEALEPQGSAKSGPVVFADCADNPGAGAPGDSTFMLRELLMRGVRHVALGPLWDPLAVSLCACAGVGAEIALRVGGKCSAASGDPVDLRVAVRGLNSDLQAPAFGGECMRYGEAAWVEVLGADLHIVLNSYRMQAFGPEVFMEMGMKLHDLQLIVVKSSNHFEAGFRALASRIVHIVGPGAVTLSLDRIPYTRRSLDYWPRLANPFPEGAV